MGAKADEDKPNQVPLLVLRSEVRAREGSNHAGCQLLVNLAEMLFERPVGPERRAHLRQLQAIRRNRKSDCVR